MSYGLLVAVKYFFSKVWSSIVKNSEISLCYDSKKTFEATVRQVMQNKDIYCKIPVIYPIQHFQCHTILIMRIYRAMLLDIVSMIIDKINRGTE